MDIAGDFRLWVEENIPRDPGTKPESNVWGFELPWSAKPLMVTEDDPRWQGCFLHHLIDFMYFLGGALRDGEPIQVS